MALIVFGIWIFWKTTRIAPSASDVESLGSDLYDEPEKKEAGSSFPLVPVSDRQLEIVPDPVVNLENVPTDPIYPSAPQESIQVSLSEKIHPSVSGSSNLGSKRGTGSGLPDAIGGTSVQSKSEFCPRPVLSATEDISKKINLSNVPDLNDESKLDLPGFIVHPPTSRKRSAKSPVRKVSKVTRTDSPPDSGAMNDPSDPDFQPSSSARSGSVTRRYSTRTSKF